MHPKGHKWEHRAMQERWNRMKRQHEQGYDLDIPIIEDCRVADLIHEDYLKEKADLEGRIWTCPHCGGDYESCRCR